MDINKIFEFTLISPKSGLPLIKEKDYLISQNGEKFPIINNIPRFVPKDNYASAFGLQWNTYRTTQLDSFTGVPLSRVRLTRIVGGSLDIFHGKRYIRSRMWGGQIHRNFAPIRR